MKYGVRVILTPGAVGDVEILKAVGRMSMEAMKRKLDEDKVAQDSNLLVDVYVHDEIDEIEAERVVSLV